MTYAAVRTMEEYRVKRPLVDRDPIDFPCACCHAPAGEPCEHDGGCIDNDRLQNAHNVYPLFGRRHER